MTDLIDGSKRTIKIRMLKTGIFSPKLPCIKVSEAVYLLRNTTFDKGQLADALEESMRVRGLL